MRTNSPELLEEAVDPELLALPAPSQVRKWALTGFMALSTAAAIGLLLMLRADLAFAFAPADVVPLGAATALDARALEAAPSNRVVRVEGTPMMAHTVHFTRLFGESRYAFFPLAGQRDVYVQVELSEGEEGAAVAHGAFEGRLVRVSELGGRLGDVPAYMSQRMHVPIDGDSLVVLAGERPGSAAWAWLVAAFVLVVVGTNATMLVRWHRPIAD